MAFAPTYARPGFSLRAAYRNAVANIRQAAARRAAFNALYDELNAMSDRELADIGLARSEIGDVASAHAATL
ncbi:DUF1127 domain-containing protein [Primorskyibacter aestuariivivens]|uniref:DUF1127 domain-containing protein n=1 Tax=Primorskyibacter aestuariivivens TaxID=1888912 RepID=UPI0023016AA3|nr:DUF1127 domain-containing protein [Primorskyibacter aestuariivivens]MDA7430392.1 DUF1127 domain-containing protein [Primorskyibacter aestuariivivens]